METFQFELEEKMIDDLLIILNEAVEDRGKPLVAVAFDLSGGDERFFEKYPVSIDQFFRIVKKCKSRGYIKYGALGSGFRFMNLTETGRDRALQSIHKKTRKNMEIPTMQIGNLTVNGATQIGNNNVQNFNTINTQILTQIENSSFSQAEKEEAKNLWQKICENPLLCSVLGGLASGIPFK